MTMLYHKSKCTISKTCFQKDKQLNCINCLLFFLFISSFLIAYNSNINKDV